MLDTVENVPVRAALQREEALQQKLPVIFGEGIRVCQQCRDFVTGSGRGCGGNFACGLKSRVSREDTELSSLAAILEQGVGAMEGKAQTRISINDPAVSSSPNQQGIRLLEAGGASHPLNIQGRCFQSGQFCQV